MIIVEYYKVTHVYVLPPRARAHGDAHGDALTWVMSLPMSSKARKNSMLLRSIYDISNVEVSMILRSIIDFHDTLQLIFQVSTVVQVKSYNSPMKSDCCTGSCSSSDNSSDSEIQEEDDEDGMPW